MAMKNCKECSKEVSTGAKTCPHCGISNPTVKASDAIKGFLALAVVATIAVSCISDDSETGTTVSTLSDAECKQSLKCSAEKSIVYAGGYCQAPIEKLSKYTFEWTNGFTTPRFSHYRWKDQSKGLITYIGDEIKMQNGFGAWSHYTYECDFDPSQNLVLDIRAQQGRL